MSIKYKMNTTYRMTNAAVNDYMSSNSINGKIARKVGNTLWSVVELNGYGDVNVIRLASTGENVDCESLGHKGCIMFNLRELETGKVYPVKEKYLEPAEYVIMGKGQHSDKFVMIRGDNSTHTFTLEKAKDIVSTALKQSPDAEYQIFKLHLTARAERQEINVIFE